MIGWLLGPVGFWSLFYCNISCRRLFWRIVSFTAENTYSIFLVSVAVVKWWNNALSRFLLTLSNMSRRKSWTSFITLGSPLNCGKNRLKSDVGSFFFSRSVLLRKRMMETSLKHLLFTIVSKMLQLSSNRGVLLSSTITWGGREGGLCSNPWIQILEGGVVLIYLFCKMGGSLRESRRKQ